MDNPVGKSYFFHENAKEKLLFNFLFGLFIFLFLFLFKPFGLADLAVKTQLFVSLGFGAVTFFVLFIFKFLIEPIVIRREMSFFKSILWDLVIACSIGAANYFYVNLVFQQIFMFRYFLLAVWTAILVGILPVSIIHIVSYNRKMKAALLNSTNGNTQFSWEPEVLITGGNPRNELKMNPKNIVYLCSNDNYVTIVTAAGDTVSKQHIRGTLKAVEEELKKNTSFFRCHKCYIVNSEYIDHLSGNVQNMKFRLKIQGFEIPVSRQKAAEASARFK
jgi:hypothetical protein